MLTDKQLSTLKEVLTSSKEKLEKRNSRKDESFLSRSQTESIGELSSYDNHPAELGTELFERERDMAIDRHTDQELERIDNALHAISEKSYGKCKSCGEPIPFERLEVVPSTLYCVEHFPEQAKENSHPIKEDGIDPVFDNHYQNRNDDQDSFKEVASYGTSETASDFTDDRDVYHTDEDDNGYTEKYERFIGTDIKGKNTKVYGNKKKMSTLRY